VSGGYHHGNLREALVTEGMKLLDDDGVEAVTLRELARRTNVSHGAPHRHFGDRDELLGEMAARGFDELSTLLVEVLQQPTPARRLRAYLRGYVTFATERPGLVQLMFSRVGKDAEGVHEAARRFFSQGARALGVSEPGEPSTGAFLVAAVSEGISTLAIAGRLPEERVDEVIDSAVAALLASDALALPDTGQHADLT